MVAQTYNTTHQYRVSTALDFMDKYSHNFGVVSADTQVNSLYYVLGRSMPWAGADTQGNRYNDGYPPPVVNSIDQATEFFDRAIYAIKIAPEDMVLLTPRFNWSQGASSEITFAPYDPTLTYPYYSDTPFYCINSNIGDTGPTSNQIYTLAATTSFAAPSIIPVHTSGQLDGGDGYVWEYRGSLSAYTIANHLLVDWIPVQYLYTNKSSIESNANLARVLGASTILLQAAIADTIPVSDLPEFRQTGILANPQNQDQSSRATVARGPLTGGAAGSISPIIYRGSGNLLYVANRGVIIRSSGQTETLRILLDF